MCVIWLIHMCDMTHSSSETMTTRCTCVIRETFICVTWLIPMCEMTHSCVWHDSYTIKTMTERCACGWHDTLLCMTWLNQSHVVGDSFMCAAQRVYVCGRTHSYMRHNSLICVTWLIHMCDVTHSYVWRDSFISLHTPDYPITKKMLYTYLFKGLQLIRSALIAICDVTHWQILPIYVPVQKLRNVKESASRSHCNALQHCATHCNTHCCTH